MAGGYPCCCGEVGSGSLSGSVNLGCFCCHASDPAPAQVEVTLAGVTDGSCGDCEMLNGVYVCDRLSDADTRDIFCNPTIDSGTPPIEMCCWGLEFPEVCGFTKMLVTLDCSFLSPPGYVSVYLFGDCRRDVYGLPFLFGSDTYLLFDGSAFSNPCFDGWELDYHSSSGECDEGTATLVAL